MDKVRKQHEDAKQFLSEIAPDGEGVIALRVGRKQPGYKKVRPGVKKYFRANDLDAAASYVVEMAKDHDVYSGIAPHTKEDSTKETILHGYLLYSDVDTPAMMMRLIEAMEAGQVPFPSFAFRGCFIGVVTHTVTQVETRTVVQTKIRTRTVRVPATASASSSSGADNTGTSASIDQDKLGSEVAKALDVVDPSANVGLGTCLGTPHPDVFHCSISTQNDVVQYDTTVSGGQWHGVFNPGASTAQSGYPASLSGSY